MIIMMMILMVVVKLQLCKQVFLYQKGSFPEKFNSMFLTNSQVRLSNTGITYSFRLPCCTTNIKKFFILFHFPKLYTFLNYEIKEPSSITSFTTKVKTFLLSS